jgi:Glycine zipper
MSQPAERVGGQCRNIRERIMAKTKQSAKKSDGGTGVLGTVGENPTGAATGAAAGAAVGSFLGPFGAAVGAVVGGIAGAGASEKVKEQAKGKGGTAVLSKVKKAVTKGTKAVAKETKAVAKKVGAKPAAGKKAVAKKGK